MNAKVETLEEACLRVVLANRRGITADEVAHELGLKFEDVHTVLSRLASAPFADRQITTGDIPAGMIGPYLGRSACYQSLENFYKGAQ
jgi:predicted ArsR family transcriptional regulator